ncbi:hypothetical protein JCM6882_003336 [Rhodosporidiobolus microsporus]
MPSRALAELIDRELDLPPPSNPFTPLLPPRADKQRPLPPLQPRSNDSFRPGWRIDTFLVPAAFPRTQRNGTRPAGTPSPVSHRPPKGDRVDLEALLLDVVGTQVEELKKPVTDVEGDEAVVQEQEQLFLAMNRLVPLEKREDGRKGISLVLCHGTGLHKETWEPVLRPLLDESEKGGDVRVDEIFALDAVNQADSAVLNEAVMGKGSNWCDMARDLLNFLVCYLDSPTFSQPPSSSPSVLAPGSFDPSDLSLDSRSVPPPGAPLAHNRMWRGKTLVGVGHSLGGSVVGLAATAAPHVFSSILLIDPWIIAMDYHGSIAFGPAFRSVAFRRDSWESREAAVRALSGNPFFTVLDKEIVELFLKHGLRDLDDGRVALKTPAAIEQLLYANPYGWPGSYLFRRLQALDPSLPVHIFLPSHGQSIVPPDQLEKVVEGLPWVQFDRLKKAHHLVPQMQPARTGKLLAGRLREIYGRRGEGKARL